MPQPVPDPVTSTPSVPGQPYDATSDSALDRWVKLPGGPVNDRGRLGGSDFDSSGVWKQT